MHDEILSVIDGTSPWAVICGDSAEVLRHLPDRCCHAAIMDPPGGGGHLRLAWDGDRGGRDAWIAWLAGILAETRRCLLPGAYCAVWCYRTTSDWVGRALEEAGLRKILLGCHYHGAGMPLGDVDVAKAVDSLLLHGSPASRHWHRLDGVRRNMGRGITNLARMVVVHGAREQEPHQLGAFVHAPSTPQAEAWSGWHTLLPSTGDAWWIAQRPLEEASVAAQVLATRTGAMNTIAARELLGGVGPGTVWEIGKASRDEREAGCESLDPITVASSNPGGVVDTDPDWAPKERRNSHPSIKPMRLMEFFATLLTPPDGIVLDPFAGSGTTGCACRLHRRWRFLGVELSERHCAEARARIAHWERQDERDAAERDLARRGGNAAQGVLPGMEG